MMFTRIYIKVIFTFYFTISINVHCAGVPFSIVVCVYLSRVVFIGTVVASVTNFILVKVKLARIEKQGAIVLWGKAQTS